MPLYADEVYMEGITMLAKVKNDRRLIERLAYPAGQIARAVPSQAKSEKTV